MKKIKLISIFILITLYGFSQLRNNVIIKNNIFTVSYNEVYEQPNWLEYNLVSINKSVSRKGLNFYTIKNIHTSDDVDYENNVWDKGHLAPAAEFENNMENLKSTFSYLNCSLQHYSLNRGQWLHLEDYERKVLFKNYGTLRIKIVLEFKSNHEILPTGAHVPSGFTKIIYLSKKDSLVYYFPNKQLDKNFQFYKIK